jgi:hypothetical protein
MLRSVIFASLLFAPQLVAQGSLDSARAVTVKIVGGVRQTTPADARRILGALAADSMEGRATGTEGAHRAARYIAGEMKRIGLTSLGDSGFFQRVPVSMDSVAGRGGRAGGVRPRLRQSFQELDSFPPARRRTEVNVLGIIRGSDPVLRDEYILVDAHYDHNGIRTPATPGGDSIYNGADDDATGVTAVLEIARQIKEGKPPKRSIIFATMVGEEVGLLGTNWYIAHPIIPLEKTVANIEIEMIGRPDSTVGGVGRAWLTGFERSTMGSTLQASGLLVYPDARPQQGFFERSDNIGFARRGIVAHTLSSFNLHKDYHTPADEVDKTDFDHMTRLINTAAAAVRLIADGEKPVWHEGGQPPMPPARGRGGQ